MKLHKKHLIILLTYFISILWLTGLKAQIDFTYQSVFNYLKGSEASDLAADWYMPSFDDSGWSTGNAPFWYGDGALGTNLTDMQGAYSTYYLRTTFTAKNTDRLTVINVLIDYDDAFVIWINGKNVISSKNAPDILAYNAFATVNHESGNAEKFTMTPTDLNLTEGENFLAVQVFNISLLSSDIYFDVDISGEIEFPELIDTVGLSFDMPSGFYAEPFTLTITTPDPTANIVYTLDCSNPQKPQTAFTTGPVAHVYIDPSSSSGRGTTPAVVVRASIIKENYKASKPETRTYIYLKKVKSQSYPGGGWPSSDISGQTIDLLMDQRVIMASEYNGLIDDALLEIPTIAIATDLGNLFDPAMGIYVNAYGHGINWERECSAELINPDGSPGFNVNAGLRIRGGWSRHDDFPKHAFRLFFRDEYGDAKLKYPLFGDEGVSEYDKIDLRCEENYAWSNGDSHNTLVRDVFSRDTQRDMGQPYTRSRQYHLYLNGMYWGIYQTQERSEARYASDYFGDKTEDYDVIKVNTENWVYQIEASDGYMDTWQKIWNMCNTGFTSNRAYFQLEGKDASGNPVKGSEVLVDIDNLIDYMLVIFYTGNFDSPTSSFGNNKGPNNFFAIDDRTDRSRGFVFFAHDAEHAMFNEAISPGVGLYENRVNIGDRSDNMQMTVWSFGSFHPQWLHYKLSKNAEYRMRFADRAYKYMTGNGVLTVQKSLERLDRRVAEIDTAVIAESARWGAAKSWITWPYTRNDNWIPEVEKIRKNWIPYRTSIVILQLKEAGLYTSIKPPRVEKSGTEMKDDRYFLDTQIYIDVTNPNSTGVIYFTLDGTDPRLTGGGISSSAIKISKEIKLCISSSTILKARIYDNGTWSAIKSIDFIDAGDDCSSLRITELNYHPKDEITGNDTIPGQDLEFIEFKNISGNSLNLSGLVLDSAVYYAFPDNRLLGPKQFYVVASKPSKFYDYYGLIASGNFKGNFSNAGEEILLKNRQNEDLLRFSYNDLSPWPQADGTGYSMVAMVYDPTGDPGDPSYWRNSSETGGSPFRDDPWPAKVIDQTGTAGEVTVYPNPASEYIFIHINKLEDQQRLNVELLNINGVLIHQAVIVNNTAIDLRNINMPTGLYLIKVRTDKFTGTARFAFFHYE